MGHITGPLGFSLRVEISSGMNESSPPSPGMQRLFVLVCISHPAVILSDNVDPEVLNAGGVRAHKAPLTSAIELHIWWSEVLLPLLSHVPRQQKSNQKTILADYK